MVDTQVWFQDLQGNHLYPSKNTCDFCEDRETLLKFLPSLGKPFCFWLHDTCVKDIRRLCIEKGYLW